MNPIVLSVLLLLSAPDNNVEWNGISHVPEQDCRPRVPIAGETFAVRLQAYRFDIDSVTVQYDDGAPGSVAAAFIEDRGPYAVWQAQLPATSANTISYYFAITDGTDTDYYGASGMSETTPAPFTVDFVNLTHAPYGATPTGDGGAVFRVWAPSRTEAYVRGSFNGWGLGNPLSKVGDDFIGYVPNVAHGDNYKYFFQPGSLWRTDARPRGINSGDNMNTIFQDPDDYVWTAGNFSPPAFEDMIVYELHVGTFAGRNDPQASGAIPATYRDVAAHVDHLVELGVNVVELMPITEFPWDFSAGYNPITMYAPEWKHGSPDDLKYMVDVLHQNGIAVILDIVWNHFSGSDNYLWFYDGTQIYFDNPVVETPWGSQADFDNGQVRDYFIDSTYYWLDEFNLDGFRMDATEFMNIFPQEASGWSLMQWHNDVIDNRRADAISFAEQLPDDPWVTRPVSLGGAGFDSQWFDAFGDRLREAIIDASFGNANVSALADVLDGGGAYLTGVQVMNYLELHDEAWPSSGGQRLVKTIDTTFPHDDQYARGRTKLGQGVTMFAQGIPAILQGSEWLEDTDFGGGSPTGADRIDWSKKQTYADIFQYFKDIIRVRKENDAFKANSPIQVLHVNEGGDVVAWYRTNGFGNDCVVIANFSNTDYSGYQIGLPIAGTWYELVNSDAAVYGGNNVGNGGQVSTTGGAYDGQPQSAFFNLPRMGLLVLRANDPPAGSGCDGDLTGDSVVDFDDFAQLSACWDSACGDLTGDATTDFSDFATLSADWGCTQR